MIEEVDLFFKHLLLKLEETKKLWSETDEIPTLDHIDSVVKLATWAHDEWIWIHPFINGNGRTARLLANYMFTAKPFSFGPIVAVRPRPGSGYGQAAALSMANRNGNGFLGITRQ